MNTIFSHPPLYTLRITYDILDFANSGQLIRPSSACLRFTPSLGREFAYGLLQILHWHLWYHFLASFLAGHKCFLRHPCLQLYVPCHLGHSENHTRLLISIPIAPLRDIWFIRSVTLLFYFFKFIFYDIQRDFWWLWDRAMMAEL